MNIVLVHGILGFREKLGVEYFRGVAEHLHAQGHNVCAPTLDPTKGVPDRGGQLRDQINATFTNNVLDRNLKTHIIAHSMGGLDSRWMISPDNPKGIQLTIRSLTTISTPHRGSPIADWVDGAEPSNHQDDAALQAALGQLGISLQGLRDLRQDACQVFNATYGNNMHTEYFSVAGSGRDGLLKTAGFFLPLYERIKQSTGEPNDGLVTVSSAEWGTFDERTWHCDHGQEVGNDINDLFVATSFPYLERYDQIVANIAEL